VKPAPFAFFQPTTTTEAVERLAMDRGAVPMSGGQSLVPLLNLRLARPTTVIDLSRIDGLDRIVDHDDGSAGVGAMVTHTRLERHDWPTGLSALPDAVSRIGYRAIRNRGTLGGSLAHADPAAELPTMAVALDASIHLTSPEGSRMIAADDFFLGYYETARLHQELITSVSIPTPHDLRTGFAEISRRPGDFAIALAAVATWTDSGGESQARVVVGGLDVRPRRIPDLELALYVGSVGLAEATPSALETSTNPTSDIHASADYRLHVGAEMIRRAASGLGVAA
jgi:CO/xanthine dehydrogenase FAD-binding subunit